MNKQKMKNLNIMYVEDEKTIRDNVSKVLSFIFKDVVVFKNGLDALGYFEKKDNINIILSDISMPYMDGIEFSKEIRKKNKRIPIILLTAHTNKEILLEATRLKLVDYLVKPLNLEELKNALSNAVTEIEDFDNELIKFSNNVYFKKGSRQLYKDEEIIHLTNHELKFLELLLDNKNRILSEGDIKDLIWEDNFMVSDSAFKSLVNKLRKKIGKDSIKNFSKLGYQIQLN